MVGPERIQLYRTKGWRMPPNTISVARPGRWGNPFRVGDVDHKTGERIADQAHAVRLFRERWFGAHHDGLGMHDIVQHELRGMNLACWCKPGTPCHADVLIEIANSAPAPR
jgi:hypothetical protein